MIDIITGFSSVAAVLRLPDDKSRSCVGFQQLLHCLWQTGRSKHGSSASAGKVDAQFMGMQAQPVKSVLPDEILPRPVRSIAPVAHHRMAGQLGVPPDLVFSAGQRLTFDEGVMGAEIQCSPPGGAGRSLPPTHGIFAACCNRGQRPTPFVPIISGGWFVDPAMHHGKVAFANGSCGKLAAEPGQRFMAGRQQYDSAGIPVQTMDGMDGMTIFADSREPTPFKGGLDQRTQIATRFVVNAQPAGLFDDHPSPIAGNAGNRTGRAVD